MFLRIAQILKIMTFMAEEPDRLVPTAFSLEDALSAFMLCLLVFKKNQNKYGHTIEALVSVKTALAVASLIKHFFLTLKNIFASLEALRSDGTRHKITAVTS
ncbi:hypothetical protein ACJX0J_015747 [Zea mays]